MPHSNMNDIRRQARREAIRLLAEDPYADENHNKTLLAAVLHDRHPEEWGPLWEDLRDRVQWLQALEDGADPGCDDDGRPEDRETVKDDVRSDINALLDHLSLIPDAPLGRAA